MDENLIDYLYDTKKIETGIVKWFSPKKGYGFIIRDSIPEGEANHEIFVHYSQVNMEGFKTLLPDLHVSFAVAEGKHPGTAEAVHVKILPPRFPQKNELIPT